MRSVSVSAFVTWCGREKICPRPRVGENHENPESGETGSADQGISSTGAGMMFQVNRDRSVGSAKMTSRTGSPSIQT